MWWPHQPPYSFVILTCIGLKTHLYIVCILKAFIYGCSAGYVKTLFMVYKYLHGLQAFCQVSLSVYNHFSQSVRQFTSIFMVSLGPRPPISTPGYNPRLLVNCTHGKASTSLCSWLLGHHMHRLAISSQCFHSLCYWTEQQSRGQY